ncbi:MAG TPA: membrane protein insertion efficiency factor YidD [Burkholderiales bacterium]|nr:membrane protein insertion efficiency factor YidD [Burkholderiales bacterium]
MKRVFIFLIDGYKLLLSPFFGQQCRFYPTCSSYAKEAIERHGALRGSWLGLKRIVRCNPWCAGGVDEVPPVKPPVTG